MQSRPSAVASGVWFWLPVLWHVGAIVLARRGLCAYLNGMCFGGEEAAAICHSSPSQESAERSIETDEARLCALSLPLQRWSGRPAAAESAAKVRAITAQLWEGWRACVTEQFRGITSNMHSAAYHCLSQMQKCI